MTPDCIKIPQDREDLKAKIIELYSRYSLAKDITDIVIVSEVQRRNQFSSTDEQSFRERIRYELQELVLEIAGNHTFLSFDCWYELQRNVDFICDWFKIAELELSDEIKQKIASEEKYRVYTDFNINKRIAELYKNRLPKAILPVFEQIQSKYQFSNSDEYSFRKRVRSEIKNAILVIESNHTTSFVKYCFELGNGANAICNWLRTMELGLHNDVTNKIISEEKCTVFDVIMASHNLKIPQSREDLKVKIAELYQITIPENILGHIEQLQRRNQFISSNEQSFRERVRHEIQEAVLEIRSNHFSQSANYWVELDSCDKFIRNWMTIMELGVVEDRKYEIAFKEALEIFGVLNAEAKSKANYEVVRNIEVFHKGTSKVIFNKYVYSQAGG